MGFLISWNGFHDTVTSEKLRSSHERILIVTLTGKEIRNAVKTNSFVKMIENAWDREVLL